MSRRPNRAKVLVTGFEPFGGDPVNPSALLAQAPLAVLIAVGAIVEEAGARLRRTDDHRVPLPAAAAWAASRQRYH